MNCITFNPEAQQRLPQHIRERMNRDKEFIQLKKVEEFVSVTAFQDWLKSREGLTYVSEYMKCRNIVSLKDAIQNICDHWADSLYEKFGN